MDHWVTTLVLGGGYWGIALLMALENVVPPIPSELIMGLAGIAAARGSLNLWLAVLAGTVGTTAGNYFWYAVGRHFGFERLKGFIDRYGRWLTVEWEDVEKVNAVFRRHGGWIVFVFRFLPVFRTMVSLPAGLFGMSRLRFLAWTFAGSAIWNLMLGLAGYWLGSRFEEIDRYIGPVGTACVVLFVLTYLYRVISWKPRAAR